MKKLALIILDGWGIGEEKENNAIHLAETPFFDSIWKNCPHTQLQASGEYVGLPEGQIGGSEVGHLTIGAGRVLYQDLPKINKGLRKTNGKAEILNSPIFSQMINLAKQRPLHLIGLVSNGGIHSYDEHLLSFLEILKEQGVKEPYIHFISDGRDSATTASLHFAEKLLKKIAELHFGKVATLIGRFYAMDRDKNWERTQKAVHLYTKAAAELRYEMTESFYENLSAAIKESHKQNITDEFIEPAVIDKNFLGIQEEEPVFFLNFRSDRMKQLVSKISEALPQNPIFTVTQYDKSYSFHVLFEKESVSNTLGEVLSSLGVKQLRVTETEKIPHVTYFFNGGVEVIFEGEIRSFADSNKVKHDEMPEMQSGKIAQNIRQHVEKDNPEFVVVNFANSDMVGHTGNFQATLKALKKVDLEMKNVCEFLAQKGYICCITADHGNAEKMFDLETKEIYTAHTMNPVPFIVYDPFNPNTSSLKLSQDPNNGLSMIAGTVTDLMQIPRSKHSFKSLIL